MSLSPQPTYAGFWRRWLALVLDNIVLLICPTILIALIYPLLRPPPNTRRDQETSLIYSSEKPILDFDVSEHPDCKRTPSASASSASESNACTLWVVYVAEQDGQADLFLENIAFSGAMEASTNPLETILLPLVYKEEKTQLAMEMIVRLRALERVDADAGRAPLRLTNDPAREDHPRFMPGLRKIAFTRERPDGSPPEIAIIRTLGGESFTAIAAGRDPAWHPSENRIAFVRLGAGQPEALATADADRTDVRVLLEGEKAYPVLRHPAWAPDGSQVAVVRSSDEVSGEVWLVPATAGPPRRLGTDPAISLSTQLGFTPDGRSVVYSSSRAGVTTLSLLSLDTGQASPLAGGSPRQSPRVLSNGSIAFAGAPQGSQLFLYGPRPGQPPPPPTPMRGPDPTLAIIAAIFLAGLLYYSHFESSAWQATPGKKVMGLVVTDLEGNRLSFSRAAVRTLAKVLSALILFLGFAMAGFTEKRQALHDQVAGCLVIKKS